MSDPISALIGVGGTIVGGLFGNSQQDSANKANKEMMESNQAWNTSTIANAQQYDTQMANTVHQREVADLKAAGINPMMTAMGGNGAPAPTSPVTNAGVGNAIQPNMALPNAISGAVSNALQAQKTVADIKNTEKDSIAKEAQAIEATSRSNANTASAAQLQEATLQMARNRSAAAATSDARENSARLDKQNEATERLLGMMKQGSGIVNDAAGAATNLLPSQLFKNYTRKSWNEGYKQGTRNGIPQ